MPIKDFPFKPLKEGGSGYPCLNIRIINLVNGIFVPVIGIIDTGADDCAIPAYYAGLLRHNLKKGYKKEIITGNGITFAYSHTTTIDILNNDDKVVYRIEETPIDYMENLHVVLLGVNSFLSKFILTIDYPAKKFSIQLP